MIPINETDDKITRGIFPDIVKVVVVMVIIFKCSILLCIHVCIFSKHTDWLTIGILFSFHFKISILDQCITFFDVSVSASEYEFYLFKDSDVSSLKILYNVVY